MRLSLQSPSQGKDNVKPKLDALYAEIQEKFRQMVE
jgi:V-type H+-transporting ATPase subunit A